MEILLWTLIFWSLLEVGVRIAFLSTGSPPENTNTSVFIGAVIWLSFAIWAATLVKDLT